LRWGQGVDYTSGLQAEVESTLALVIGKRNKNLSKTFQWRFSKNQNTFIILLLDPKEKPFFNNINIIGLGELSLPKQSI